VQKLQKKYRRSYEREKILKTLCSTKMHPTADWVYKNLEENGEEISLATVYRNLSILCEQGLATKLDIQNQGESRYDGNTQPHNHFVCKKYGYIYDSCMNAEEGVEKYVVCSRCM
jgi:Fur family transcriptional regulator, peroxide stress response regulator